MGFKIGGSIGKIARGLVGGPVTLSNPTVAGGLIGAATGGIGGALLGGTIGRGLSGVAPQLQLPGGPNALTEDELFRLRAEEEERRRKELAGQQQQQILDFADEFETDAATRRESLATALADTAQETFERANPFLLEDLQARGLFTSGSEVARSQTEALADLARESDLRLQEFDTDIFNQLQDLRGTALSSLLGGEQDALDAALELRRGSLTRSLDRADADADRRLADFLSRRQSRDNLIGSLIGGAGSVLGGALGGGFFGAPRFVTPV